MGSGYPGGLFFGQYSQGGTVPASAGALSVRVTTVLTLQPVRAVTTLQSDRTVDGTTG